MGIWRKKMPGMKPATGLPRGCLRCCLKKPTSFPPKIDYFYIIYGKITKNTKIACFFLDKSLQ